MPAQQTPQPTTTRGRGRGGANVVAKRGGRQGTPPPQDPQQNTKKVTFQQPGTSKGERQNQNKLKWGLILSYNQIPLHHLTCLKFMK